MVLKIKIGPYPNLKTNIFILQTTKDFWSLMAPNGTGFYNNDGEFILEPGEFKVYVGGSSKTVLESKFNIE